MKATRRHIVGWGSTALLLQAPQLVFGAEIVAVRVWPAAEYTRVTIESDAALVWRYEIAACRGDLGLAQRDDTGVGDLEAGDQAQ